MKEITAGMLLYTAQLTWMVYAIAWLSVMNPVLHEVNAVNIWQMFHISPFTTNQ